ncbi:hypothetical protein [Nonlabens agnitus]|uniref:Response regulatory domain-containing protein n=1 Tax=Nonlabens agnitus TaxID=870484 RepID=A0A2S9WSN4_9FLAO|nr:hypothetical protein [Nonlabens agnitus]PRP66487.1 hypothetical protein BST86_04950 [Nonlabens agnitus]
MGKILIYDDEISIVKKIKADIRGLDLGLKPITFITLDSLREYIYSDDNWMDVKAVIFDLAQKNELDSQDMDFDILKDIKHCFHHRRVPIFIHSAYAMQVEELSELPTVLLFKKGAYSIRNVRDHLAKLQKSGFLDLFSEGRLLNDQISILKRKVNLDDEVLKARMHSEFTSIALNENFIEEIDKILQLENPARETFLKYLKPAVKKIIDSHS